ncbi:MAG: DUF1573 domain-containing protein [Bacteroidia bacterium]|nr:DUF1573 domain-containing protein [Bacteroidia bacterium]
MKKLVFTCILAFTITGLMFSQSKKATISFDTMENDFGTVKEEGGPVTCTFEFTNTGGEPLIINNCKSSCGCTTPDWTKAPVMPGKKGFVKATYDPKNRPGKFDKTITVTSNADPGTNTLRIFGSVTEKVKTTEDLYPQKMGDLRLKSNHIAFVKIFNTQVKSDSLEIINTTDAPMKIGFSNIPAHIKMKAVPESLKPNQKGLVIATYDATKKSDWGFIMDRVDMTINDKTDPNYKLSISATIEEDFSKYTKEQLDNAPKIVFDDVNFDFGTIKQGAVAEHEYKFKNEGRGDLVIRKTKASCGCTAVNPPNTVIKPGESSAIKVSFNSSGKNGKQNKTVTVTTNDPKNYSMLLNIKGTVEGGDEKKDIKQEVH